MIIKPENIDLKDGYVLLDRVEVTTEGFGGAQSTEDKPHVGKIVNIGSGSPGYSIGDIVLIGMYDTSTISMNGKMYYLAFVESIVGKIKDTQ